MHLREDALLDDAPCALGVTETQQEFPGPDPEAMECMACALHCSWQPTAFAAGIRICGEVV